MSESCFEAVPELEKARQFHVFGNERRGKELEETLAEKSTDCFGRPNFINQRFKEGSESSRENRRSRHVPTSQVAEAPFGSSVVVPSISRRSNLLIYIILDI